MKKEFSIWSEKYRPQTIDECILPNETKNAFKNFVEKKDIPNMLLSGKPGIGKTTVALAMCKELDCDVLFIKGSDENGIDVLRGKINTFASTVSLSGGMKVVIIDEGDGLSPAMMLGLRNAINEFSKNCRFIITCNYQHKLNGPLISRLTVFEFSIHSKDKSKLAAKFMKRIENILEIEKVDYDKKVLAEVIMKFFPDFRKTLSELQRYFDTNGKIDVGVMAYIQNISVKELMGFLKDKQFSNMRKWVAENLESDPAHIVRTTFESLEDYLLPASIPAAILILADYQYKAAFVADHEINMTAMFTQIMAECVFKE